MSPEADCERALFSPEADLERELCSPEAVRERELFKPDTAASLGVGFICQTTKAMTRTQWIAQWENSQPVLVNWF